jgi:hypothetical protein
MTMYRPPEAVAHVVIGGDEVTPVSVYLMQLPDALPQVLRGSAAVIWIVASEGDPQVAAGVASLVGRTEEEVSVDVAAFLDELVAAGLLEVVTGGRMS